MADTKISALTSATNLTGTEEVPVVQGGVTKKTTISDIRVWDKIAVVSTDHSHNSTTAAAVTALTTSLEAGTWLIKLWCCLTSAATTTGPGLYLNCSGGTVTRCVATQYTLTTGTTATTGIMDQATTGTNIQTMEGRAQRANNTSQGTFLGVDTASADQFLVMEGIVIVTATTSLQVMLASEVASSAIVIQEGTTLTCSKVA